MGDPDLRDLVASVRRALDETEAEYARMPVFVRLLVRRGFAKRTGLDFAAWRALLDRSGTGRTGGTGSSELVGRLPALAEHYRGAPERARRGRGATPDELEIIEERSRARAAAADALRAALAR